MRAAFDRASYKGLSILALICIGSCGSPVFAASAPTAYTRDADNLPFGLDRIRWGMSSAEVELAYPELKFTSSFEYPAGSAWGPRELSTYQYRYGDCVFDVVFNFFHARVASVYVKSAIDGDPARLRACRMQVRQEFVRRYGPPEAGYPHWDGPVTNLYYDLPQFAVPLPPPGPRQPRPLAVMFSDARDISGASEDSRDRDNQCLSITAEFIGDASNAGASEPFIVPGIRNLGCDYYPPVSWRLQEQGKVTVEAHILPNGSVADAKLTTPNRSPRLNATALDIVNNRLTINPAFTDGKPAEATRQIAVTFTLTHFIHGQE